MRATLDDIAYFAESKRETVLASYQMARAAIDTGVPGDFVECGVYCGSQVAAMAMAIMEIPAWGRPVYHRRVHLFDSFAGIPKAGPRDGMDIGQLVGYGDGRLETSGQRACSIEAVKANMQRWGIPDELLDYHPGWFQHTTAEPGIEQIAVLRLDGDLYESTKVCLDNLYPLVSLGGWVIVDDFELEGARAALLECVPHTGPVYFKKL